MLWGLSLSWVGESVAQKLGAKGLSATLPQPNASTHMFQPIDQPLWLKASVTAIGLVLIGLELWWFLLSKPRSR
ncbi:MAG: hypothetical protein WCD18_02310 [Thermosynechococcaceae cyanobacterium]